MTTQPAAIPRPLAVRRRGLSRPSGSIWVAVLIPLLGYVSELIFSQLVGDTRFGTTLPPWVVALMALPAFVALVWRRDHLRIALAVSLVQVIVLFIVLPVFQPFASFVIPLHALARHRPLRTVALGLIPWLVPLFLIIVVGPIERGYPEDIPTLLIFWGAGPAIAVALGHGQRRSDEIHALQIRTTEAEHALHLQDDRLRVARELHDRVASSIAATLVGVDGMQRNHADLPVPAQEMLALTSRSAHLAMSELRYVLDVLRTGGTDVDIDEGLLPADLGDLVSRLESDGLAGVEVAVTTIGVPGDTDAQIEHCAALCLLEAATNAVKYGASVIEIELDYSGADLVARVRNANGRERCTDPALRGGMGLSGIMERASLVGGSVRLELTPGSFVLVLHLPRTLNPDVAAD
ncbi:MAG TPA: hypothetical protein GXZ60_09615 [Intrasporangiaceae bacterium]|nr:hypothetical protein [Intrasporangiaceae bacterium]